MNQVKTWITATRPRTLPFGAAPVFIGSALSLHMGYFSWSTFFICLFSALLLQIGANFANDVFDFENGVDTVNRTGPVRAVASGALSSKSMKQGMILSFTLAFLCSTPILYREGWILALLFLLVVLVAIGYSGGPSPLSYQGLGEVTNLMFMAGLPTLIMCYVLTGKLMLVSFWLGISMGGTTSAVMCMNNLRDEITDRETNKNTLVVRFGRTFGQYLFAFLTLYPFVLPWALIYFYGLPIGVGAVSILVLPAIPLLSATFSAKQSLEFSEIFPKAAILALAYMLTLSYGLIL